MAQLNRLFIERANSTPGRPVAVPVEAKPREDIGVGYVAVMTRWQALDSPKRLAKRYGFMRPDLRTRFVNELMAYEDSVSHYGILTVAEESVDVEVWTKGVDIITELDKEYALYADSLYRDVVYNIGDGRQSAEAEHHDVGFAQGKAPRAR
jgi:pterin-4a-carbinolamine dehydratase